MIDLHCHILPALDDGALDLDDSVGMARQAEADGVATVCATPHIRHDHNVPIAELPVRVRALNEELARRGVAVRVVPGGEVAETALAGLDDGALRAVSLGGGGRWILLEPAPGPLSDSLAAAVGELARRGFRSVIAHPERHLGHDFDSRLAQLVELDALVQVTADLLEQRAPAIVDVARRGLVHLLGSDAHSSRAGRPVRLSGALDALGDVEPLAPHVDWIVRTAPAAILRGDEVEPPFCPSR